MTKRLTKAALERELRKLLASGARLSLRAMRKQAAYTYVDQRPHPIVVDTYQVGKLEAVLHELIHCARDSALHPWGDFEEPLVWAITAVLAEHITARPRLDAQWRKLIDQARGSE